MLLANTCGHIISHLVECDALLLHGVTFTNGDGLIVELERGVAPAGYESLGIHAPFTRSKFNFVMQKAANEDEALPLTRMERVTTPT